MRITFLIPNRDDPEQPPTLYQDWSAESIPHEGESVFFGDLNGQAGSTWRVKWVRHTFQTDDRSKPTHSIEVRLIEPELWTQV